MKEALIWGKKSQFSWIKKYAKAYSAMVAPPLLSSGSVKFLRRPSPDGVTGPQKINGG
jgi:hypothetical protein